jgi:hypothetical protein
MFPKICAGDQGKTLYLGRPRTHIQIDFGLVNGKTESMIAMRDQTHRDGK